MNHEQRFLAGPARPPGPRFENTRLPPDFEPNVYKIAAAVLGVMREADVASDERERFAGEVRTSTCYAAALAICGQWIVLDDWLAEQGDELRGEVAREAEYLAQKSAPLLRSRERGA
jgi:hypothetical protein